MHKSVLTVRRVGTSYKVPATNSVSVFFKTMVKCDVCMQPKCYLIIWSSLVRNCAYSVPFTDFHKNLISGSSGDSGCCGKNGVRLCFRLEGKVQSYL